MHMYPLQLLSSSVFAIDAFAAVTCLVHERRFWKLAELLLDSLHRVDDVAVSAAEHDGLPADAHGSAADDAASTDGHADDDARANGHAADDDGPWRDAAAAPIHDDDAGDAAAAAAA